MENNNLNADDMEQFKKEQKDFEVKKAEIIKTNEEIKKKLDRIRERAQEIKNQSKPSGEDNA